MSRFRRGADLARRPRRLEVADLVAAISGALLLASLAKLPWFGPLGKPPTQLVPQNIAGGGQRHAPANGLESFALIDIVLIAVAIAAIALVAIGLAGVPLRARRSARRVVAGLGLLGMGLILYRIAEVPALEHAPWGPGVDVTRKAGLAAGLVAAAGIAVNDVLSRAAATSAQPPATTSAPAALAAPAEASPPSPVSPAPGSMDDRSPPPGPDDEPPAVPQPEDEPPLVIEPTAPQDLDRPDDADPRRLSLAGAGFEDLRELGLSVTQAKRVLRYRDELGTVATVAGLDDVPGLPRALLVKLKDRLED